MTRIEQKMTSINKEIEKYKKSIERIQKSLNKKTNECIGLNCNWSKAEMLDHRDNNEMSDKQWAAWFKKGCLEEELQEYEKKLANAVERLSKNSTECAKQKEKQEEDMSIQNKENTLKSISVVKEKQDYDQWVDNFKEECLKDGIDIKDVSHHYIVGATPSGNTFVLTINNGATIRSRTSYTLHISGEMIFTSGLFSTGYKYIKNN